MRQLVYEKENSEFKPVKLRLKIDLVSYPDRAEELVNTGQGDLFVSQTPIEASVSHCQGQILVYYYYCEFFTPALNGVFSLCHSKSPQVSRGLLNILADFNNALVRVISIFPLIYNLSCVFPSP